MALNADQAQRQLARRSLRAVCVLMSLGSGYGFFVAGPAGLLTPFEWVTIPMMLLTGLGMLALLAWRGAEYGLERIAFGLSVWLCLYIAGNVGNALFFSTDGDKIFIHLGWAIPLYLFLFAINPHRQARYLGGTTVVLNMIMIVVYLVLHHGDAPSSQFDALVSSGLLAQPAALALISAVALLRERYAAEAAVLAAAAESSTRITALAEQLRDSESRARRLIELAPDVPCLLDAEGRLTDIGPNCRRIWGLDRTALIGRPFASLFASDDQATVDARLNAARQAPANAPRSLQPGRIRHADGYDQPVLWYAIWSPADNAYYVWAQASE